MDKFVTVRHLRRNDSPFGGVTILAVVNLDDDCNRNIMFSMAFCSPKDLYCKETGRSVALSRMIEGHVYDMPYTDYETGGSIENQIVNFISESETISSDDFRLFYKCQNDWLWEDSHYA